MWRSLSSSMLDQAVLSGLALGINLALITFSAPGEFGLYVLAMSVLLMASAIQGALIGAPLMIALPRRPKTEWPGFVSMLASAQMAFCAIAVAVTFAVGTWVAPDLVHTLAIVGLVATGLQRDMARGYLIASDRMPRCLVLDAGFAVAAIVAIPALWQFLPPAAAAVGGMALANLIAVLLLGPPLGRTLNRPRKTFVVYMTHWHEVRWTLAGVATTEVQNRAYVFLVEAFRNTAALGVVQAGRVVTSPITLLAHTWGQAAIPRLGALLGSGQRKRALSLLSVGIAINLGISFAYILFLYLAWAHIEAFVFRGRYPDIDMLVLGWLAYSLLSVPRGCMGTFLFSERRLRETAVVAFAAAIASTTLLLVLATNVHVGAAIACLAMGELIMLVWMIRLVARPPAPAPVVKPDAPVARLGAEAEPR